MIRINRPQLSARTAVICCEKECLIGADQIAGVTAGWATVDVCIAFWLAVFFAEILAPKFNAALTSIG